VRSLRDVMTVTALKVVWPVLGFVIDEKNIGLRSGICAPTLLWSCPIAFRQSSGSLRNVTHGAVCKGSFTVTLLTLWRDAIH
jgi:hypothetical protein